jgi:hypothetical protein
VKRGYNGRAYLRSLQHNRQLSSYLSDAYEMVLQEQVRVVLQQHGVKYNKKSRLGLRWGIIPNGMPDSMPTSRQLVAVPCCRPLKV